MTDLLLVVGLAVVWTLLACVTGGVVIWTRSRPRRMMRWAVQARAEMTRLESVMWLAVRRGRRAVQLFCVAMDELTPTLAEAGVAMRELGEAIEGAEREARP